jgi:uncharacterized protein
MKLLYNFIILLFVSLSYTSYSQINIPNLPEKETAVYDAADLLSAAEENALEQKLIKYADSTSTQIVIVTINSLEGEYIALFAAEWAEKWGIGQKGKDNGAIILVSKEDRKITIQNGYGLEEFLTDYNSKTIIDQIMQPEFKSGNFYAGFDKATTAIFKVLAGQFNADEVNQSNEPSLFTIIVFIFIVFFIIYAISKRNKNGGSDGSVGRTPSIFDILVLSNMGSSRSSSSGSFGGGGFSGGFGAGSFGGGGASGGW